MPCELGPARYLEQRILIACSHSNDVGNVWGVVQSYVQKVQESYGIS